MKTVLVIDDDESIRVLLRHHLRKSGLNVLSASSGEEGLRYCDAKTPDLILLDINMPQSRFSGLDILPLIKTDKNISNIPVIMITSRNDLATLKQAVLLQAVGYITKPFKKEYLLKNIDKHIDKREEENWNRLDSEVHSFLVTTRGFFNNLESKFSNFPDPGILETAEHIAGSILSIERGKLITIVETLKNHNALFFSHSTRVAIYLSFFVASLNEERSLFSNEEAREIITGGLLHDLGITRVPPHIMVKKAQGEISPRDLKEWEGHVENTVEMLAEIPGTPKRVVDMAKNHHEVWDGSGFPGHIRGGDIGVPALMTAIVDAFEYATASRTQEGMGEFTAVKEMSNRKARYDELLFTIFQKMIEAGFAPTG